MRENLSLYHIFYTVGRTGSISQAARELYISQPAITKAIKKLEENLDTVLFKRTSRGVTSVSYTHLIRSCLFPLNYFISTSSDTEERVSCSPAGSSPSSG